jgi:branched-chain amino acid transport system permease protein
MQLIMEMTINGMMLATSMMLVGLGFTLLHSILRVVNLAHGEFYMLAAMLVWYFTSTYHLSYPLTILISMAIVIAFGLLVERYTLRKFRGDLLSGLIVSMGLVFILQQGALLTFGTETKNLSSAFPGTVTLAGIQISKERVVISLISLVVITVLLLFVNYFKAGRAMRAVAQDEDAARLQGVSIRYICTLTMALACGLGAIAGGLMAPVFMIVPTMGLPFLLKTIIAITLGGIGSIGGAILGSIIVGMVESYFSTLIAIEVAYIVLFGILSLILIVRPGGFFGTPYEYV